MGDLDPHLIHGSLDPPESTTRVASRPVQPFLQHSRSQQTDRQTDRATDRPRYSVCSNGPHLASATIRPNKCLNYSRDFTFGGTVASADISPTGNKVRSIFRSSHPVSNQLKHTKRKDSFNSVRWDSICTR